MTRTFDDDEAKRRDALYQALRPIGAFREALADDRYAAQLDREGADIAAARACALRDADLLRLAIRALKARQEVTPGDN